MGVGLTPIIPRKIISFKFLRSKIIALDAYGELYQFLSIIRKPDGTPFTAPDGSITSHIIGLVFRVTKLMSDYGMRFIFVFDGPPHPLKLKTLESRRRQREKAYKEWMEALKKGDYETAFSKAVMALKLTKDMAEEAKVVLKLMGIPVVEAARDAEAQAAYMVRKGDAWAVGSKDYDSLLYGARILVRYITLTGKEFLPSKGTFRPLLPELIVLEDVLRELEITREQLVDIAILIGTDFNEGVKGVGPKTALKLIKMYGCIERLPKTYREKLTCDVDEVRRIFLEPEVNEKYRVEFNAPDVDGLAEFLRDKGFSEKRIKTVVERLKRITPTLSYGGLGRWIK